MDIVFLGIDLGKNSCSVAGLDERVGSEPHNHRRSARSPSLPLPPSRPSLLFIAAFSRRYRHCHRRVKHLYCDRLHRFRGSSR